MRWRCTNFSERLLRVEHGMSCQCPLVNLHSDSVKDVTFSVFRRRKQDTKNIEENPRPFIQTPQLLAFYHICLIIFSLIYIFLTIWVNCTHAPLLINSVYFLRTKTHFKQSWTMINIWKLTWIQIYYLIYDLTHTLPVVPTMSFIWKNKNKNSRLGSNPGLSTAFSLVSSFP